MRAIVTGGASGIGIETVRALAKAGAQVTVAVRNEAVGNHAAASINAELSEARVDSARLDLADLKSIRSFATAWGSQPLHFLINNAGIMGGPLERTVDGLELNFGVNHLGHALLFDSLLPNLERAGSSRVIQLSSGAHLRWPVDLEDWNFLSQPYDAIAAYGRSKTATALSAVVISNRYSSRGIQSYSVMPGVIRTPLFRHTDEQTEAQILARVGSLVKTPEQGAATTVWAAVAPELEGRGGLYLENCAIAKGATMTPPTGVAPHAQDPEIAEWLWQVSLDAVHG
ncbi:TPA: SDR family NAD(P)-dependent oxidoreductase [Burkholderia cenocepacia]|nr:SDR family NAD(P)-dependent oxidoreductase [Burkholderia cenocepacia]